MSARKRPRPWCFESGRFIPRAPGPHPFRRSELLERWHELPWRRRCQDQWIDRYKGIHEMTGGRKDPVYYAPFVLMATPKFDAEVSIVEPDFVEEIAENAQGLHGYRRASGKPYDLVFEWAKANRDVAGKGACAAVDRGYWAVDENSVAIKAYRNEIAWLA